MFNTFFWATVFHPDDDLGPSKWEFWWCEWWKMCVIYQDICLYLSLRCCCWLSAAMLVPLRSVTTLRNLLLHTSHMKLCEVYMNDHRSKFSNLSNWKPWFFFRLLLSNCLNWKIYYDDHSSLSSTTAVQKWIISYTLYAHNFTPHERYELNKLSSFPMCGFIAQLVEQRTGNAEVTGSNPVEGLIFLRLLLSNCLNWKIYSMIILHFHLQPQFKNELFQIYFK